MKLQADIEEEVLVHIYRYNWREKKKKKKAEGAMDNTFPNLEGTECISGHCESCHVSTHS